MIRGLGPKPIIFQGTLQKFHWTLNHGCRLALSGCVLCAQLCLTLCDPVDCRPPGSSVHGIFQNRRLEWAAISFSRGSSQLRDWSLQLLHWQANSLYPIPVHFSSLIPRMSTFTLGISCLATSNLPWFMDLTFQVPVQYSIGPCFHHQLHPQLGGVFALTLFILSWVIFHWSLVHIGQLLIWEVHLSVSYLSAFSYCSWGSQGLPFPSPVDHILSELSTMTHPSSVALHVMAHCFTELYKVVVHVI